MVKEFQYMKLVDNVLLIFIGLDNSQLLKIEADVHFNNL